MNDKKIQLFTIGFTGKSAEDFFGKIKQANVKKIIDTRLWATSQLAAFARKKDLPFFLKQLCDVAYEYSEICAPTQDILKAYKEEKITWAEYECEYKALINTRDLEEHFRPQDMEGACLLCACKDESKCHRRLLAEFFQEKWPNVQVTHL